MIGTLPPRGLMDLRPDETESVDICYCSKCNSYKGFKKTVDAEDGFDRYVCESCGAIHSRVVIDGGANETV